MASKRKSNFSAAEQTALADIIDRHPEVFQKFSGPGHSKSQKEDKWRVIQREMTALFEVTRTVEEIKKKWTDMKYAAKKEVAKYRREVKKTGGGPPPPPVDELHEKIIRIVGEEAVDGVVGGIDTGETVQPVIAGQGDAGPAARQDHYETDRERQPKKRKQNDDSSVAGEMLKTQQEILVTLQDLAATQRRSVLVQERLLTLEEYRVYGRVVGESGSYAS